MRGNGENVVRKRQITCSFLQRLVQWLRRSHGHYLWVIRRDYGNTHPEKKLNFNLVLALGGTMVILIKSMCTLI